MSAGIVENATMSENKHTPGPWKVATTYKLAERGAAEVVPWNDQGRTLALTQTVKGYSPDESLANARLIAAAPELLEACRILADYFGGHDANDIPAQCGSGVRDALVAARAAIAKATA